MRGILFTAGEGTRLRPVTESYNKGMALVYDKPMIHYPLTTLKEMGCDEVTIVSNPLGMAAITQYVKDGEGFNMDATYRIQAPGTSFAKAISKLDVSGVFPFMLGDCYYSEAPKPNSLDHPTLFWHEFETANQHSVWNPETNTIIEKPRLVDLGRRAIISYFYDERLIGFADSFKPEPGTGQLEIVDIHNFYRQQGAEMVEYTGFFGDMGTPDGLLRVANYEANRE